MADEQLNQVKISKQKPIKNIIKKENLASAPVKKEEKKEEIKDVKEEIKEEVKKSEEPKKEVKKVEKKVVKTEAIINGKRLPISLKDSIAIGNFIKNKKIEDAISDLELVLKKKKAIPFRGELPHRKGKRMMSGKYPINASSHFIKLLKSLSANSSNNSMDLDRTIITSIIPNKAPQQLHRFGSTKFKRTHVTIISKQMNTLEKGSQKGKK